ncbi:EAL domain-containing protein [Affinibrenneria salicis]|uniref:EAL domain-containing protein n=1 Tax=Affinibrenneria salicis TaxID=2590031 RepID=A0A5J5G0C6_9GAMM|nr:EAL domain-containing protein [Affinibrenneria salicis]KAA8999041.1 EAL domain-containing protein [Affinibrenneria salicis]
MYSFVARQPILNRYLQPVAYELLFRQGIRNRFPDVSAEYATTQLISEQFLTTPLNKLAGEYPCYINFPYQMLVDGQAEILPVDKVVIEILENAKPDQELFTAVKRMKKHGFRLALDDFTMEQEWNRFLPYVDIIKFDLQQSSFNNIADYINQLKYKHLTLLAEKVETYDQFLQAKKVGCSLFQGYFFSQPEMMKSKKLSGFHRNTVELLKEANRPELDYNKIETLINSDLSLAYKLMRYVNNLRYRTSSGVISSAMSFRSIAIFLGQRELRRFVSLVSITSGSENKSSELYRMSLIRGKFCELLSLQLRPSADPIEAFLCGLFSLLDAILDSPMSLLLSQISLSKEIKQALLDKSGELALYLAFIADYEQQNWPQLNRYISSMRLDERQVIQMMAEATRWSDELLEM